MICVRPSVLSLAVLILGLAGCNQNAVDAQAPESPPAPAATVEPAPPPPAEAPAPAPIPASTELPVNSVDSVMLSRPEDAPNALVIRVLGTTASTGWSLPRLEPITDGGDASIMSYRLLATSPETGGAADSPEQIVTELRVDSVLPEVAAIRVVSATNEIAAPVAQ